MSLLSTILDLIGQEEGLTVGQIAAAQRLVSFSQAETTQAAVADWKTLAPAIEKILAQVQPKGS